MFELIEAAFDAVAAAVDQDIVWDGHLAVALGGNHRFHAPDGQQGAQGVAVIGFVGDEAAPLGSGEQDGGALDIGGLPGSQAELERAARAITEEMNFGGQSSSGTPQSLVAGPPFPVAACWWALTSVASSIR